MAATSEGGIGLFAGSHVHKKTNYVVSCGFYCAHAYDIKQCCNPLLRLSVRLSVPLDHDLAVAVLRVAAAVVRHVTEVDRGAVVLRHRKSTHYPFHYDIGM